LVEATEIKRQGVERQFELSRKQLGEKIQQMQDQIVTEKETRDMWVERYDKESKTHSATSAELL